ncbi:MAG: alanine racemase [Anaerolineae bacterium]|nr:alanine racemase [Anaerolineae bacterium]
MSPIVIQKPTLLLDRQRAIRNIERMVAKAQRSDVRFRPHFKTHQSAQVGEWFRLFGVQAIVVSSVTMARYFAQHGWLDIVIAFPVNILEIESINQLAGQIYLGLLVESPEVVHFLANNLAAPVDVWLKIDVGLGRTGILWSDVDRCIAVATQIEAKSLLSLRGLLTHAGHTYRARSKTEIETIYHDVVARMNQVRDRLLATGIGPVELSIGDTPSCSVVDDLSEVDEIRPGNFVFYDVMQLQLGVCQEEDIAVAVACPVVAKHPERRQLVIYGGAVHHSKDFIIDNDRPVFGYVARLTGDGWGPRLPGVYVSGLSQEHGIITADEETIGQVQIGDALAILPVHSCLTANLLREYVTLEGEVLRCYQIG